MLTGAFRVYAPPEIYPILTDFNRFCLRFAPFWSIFGQLTVALSRAVIRKVQGIFAKIFFLTHVDWLCLMLPGVDEVHYKQYFASFFKKLFVC